MDGRTGGSGRSSSGRGRFRRVGTGGFAERAGFDTKPELTADCPGSEYAADYTKSEYAADNSESECAGHHNPGNDESEWYDPKHNDAGDEQSERHTEYDDSGNYESQRDD